MDSADPTAVPSPDPSEQAEPSVDSFGPPHPQTVSDSLHLWILIPGLIGLILIGELKRSCIVFVSCSLVTRGIVLHGVYSACIILSFFNSMLCMY